jgi:hypothetical protein
MSNDIVDAIADGAQNKEMHKKTFAAKLYQLCLFIIPPFSMLV